MCVVISELRLPSDGADGHFAKGKQSRLEEGDAPGCPSSVAEETDLAGNIMHPASRSRKNVASV